MSLRFLGTGLILLTLALVGGCHSNTSRYGSCYGQPAVVAASPGCNPCNTCGSPPPPGTIPAVVGH